MGISEWFRIFRGLLWVSVTLTHSRLLLSPTPPTSAILGTTIATTTCWHDYSMHTHWYICCSVVIMLGIVGTVMA